MTLRMTCFAVELRELITPQLVAVTLRKKLHGDQEAKVTLFLEPTNARDFTPGIEYDVTIEEKSAKVMG